MDTVWSEFCALLERKVGPQAMEIWVASGAVRPEYLNGTQVRLRAENRFSYEWVRDNLLADIRATFAEVYGHPVDVEFTVEGGLPEPERAPRERGSLHLNREMTFENFVVGKSNEFAHSAANAVADAPGTAYNPLFIHGGSGLGKTHLMHAIGNRVDRRAGQRVLYLTGQQFFDSMVSALQYKSIPQFRERFRTEVDVLLLDDVQFIAGRDRTQEEIFHVFDLMLAAKKQIVLAADQPPQEIGKLEPRLRTRFAQGLTVDVLPPDVETMMAILATKAAAQRLHLPSDVQYAIAQRVRNSVREAEGVLNRLVAMHNFYGLPITMQLLQERMGGVLPPEAPPPNADTIIQKVSEHYHLRPTDIRGDRRPNNIAHPRQVAMYLCRTVARLSFPEIGRAFGRDNSTVQYACKKMANELAKDANVRAEIDLLTRIVRGTA